ncbi:MAG: hypothetical protein Ct9H300mP11_29080 [Chloroflexota bacterium]|nr:MAG: hypothetical protein Ct9H300mP11_29080 [Chloroflexota bacterium]
MVPDYSFSLREDIKGKVFGLPRHYFFDEDPSVDAGAVAVVEKAVAELESLGAKIEEIEFPSLDYIRAANTIIMAAGPYAFHEPNLKSRPQEFGEIVRQGSGLVECLALETTFRHNAVGNGVNGICGGAAKSRFLRHSDYDPARCGV